MEVTEKQGKFRMLQTNSRKRPAQDALRTPVELANNKASVTYRPWSASSLALEIRRSGPHKAEAGSPPRSQRIHAPHDRRHALYADRPEPGCRHRRSDRRHDMCLQPEIICC